MPASAASRSAQPRLTSAPIAYELGLEHALEGDRAAQSRRSTIADPIARCASTLVPLGTVPSIRPSPGCRPDSLTGLDATHGPPSSIE